MTRNGKQPPLTWWDAIVGVGRVLGALVGWFAFTGLFTVALR